MPKLKLGDVATTFVFSGDDYIDKLTGRRTFLDESDPIAIKLKIDLSHHSKNRRNNLEYSDFDRLRKEIQHLSKLSIRDATVAKEIVNFSSVSVLEVDIGDLAPVQFSVKKQTADHREVAFEF
jgi:hypothetical protein